MEKNEGKAACPGKKGSPHSETGLADQRDDKASPPKDGRLMENEMMKAPSHEGTEKECRDLRARVAELRQETYMLSCELQKHATMCMELSDANRLLMDELKKMCKPSVIQILEAKSPDNYPQTDSEMESVEIESPE